MPCRGFNDPECCASGCGLPGARFPDETERLPLVDGEIHSVDGPHFFDCTTEQIGLRREMLLQSLNLNDRVVRYRVTALVLETHCRSPTL